MTIERINGSGFMLYCDGCPASKSLSTGYFDEAVSEAIRRGWRITKEKGEWVHYCPDCAEPEFSDLTK